jgi:hypothetical protein
MFKDITLSNSTADDFRLHVAQKRVRMNFVINLLFIVLNSLI